MRAEEGDETVDDYAEEGKQTLDRINDSKPPASPLARVIRRITELFRR
jgi:hypothetical protein